MAYSKIARALPTRPDIKELQYSGARFSRGAIAKLGQRLQSHTFFKILETIKKPEYIKKALGLNRNAPVPVSYMDKCKVPANDPLDSVEAKWISDAMMGGLIWENNEWQDYGRQYDVTSLYPNIQQSNANFPIRQGKFQTLSDFVDHRGYALYGLFCAKLIQDRKPNALIYDREARILGTVIFSEYVHFLFNIKNQGGQRKRNYKTLTTDQIDPVKFPEGHTLNSIILVGSDQWRFQFTNPGNPFKGEYPRITPFLLAHGRKTTLELLKPYKDKVRHIHTDGFILKEQPDSPALITLSRKCI
ncbi:uncharacterized protein OCT59_009337 [Rhizophagus irregularis]|uniref:uncharacterized protein n=1 Tax=Rhizophagus irregularis TaxID=588596 RepID=UPI0033167760|nr:hypothetical protein OCT59_009337 [Rhizophagus irregularis]